MKYHLPHHCVLELTYNCNHACPFCSCEWLNHPELYRQELSISEWKELLRIYAENGVGHFTFSGGEPLLKKGLCELIDYAGNLPQKLDLTLFTNGSLMNEDIWVCLQRNRVQFATSLHSVRKMPFFTGSKTTFSQVMDVVAESARRGLCTDVSMTVTKQNFKEIPNVGAAALLAGADTFLILSVMAAGRNLHHPDYMLTEEQNLKIYGSASTMQKKFPQKKVIPIVEPRCISCTEKEGIVNISWDKKCPCLKTLFTVGPGGWVRPCMHLPKDLIFWRDLDHFYDARQPSVNN